jgi:hypothetical protein
LSQNAARLSTPALPAEAAPLPSATLAGLEEKTANAPSTPRRRIVGVLGASAAQSVCRYGKLKAVQAGS